MGDVKAEVHAPLVPQGRTSGGLLLPGYWRIWWVGAGAHPPRALKASCPEEPMCAHVYVGGHQPRAGRAGLGEVAPRVCRWDSLSCRHPAKLP